MEIKCRKCGTEGIPQEAAVCPHCGAALKASIPAWVVGGFGCVGLLLAFGGFFAACLSSLNTGQPSALPAIVVMWVGMALIVAGFLMGILNWLRKRK